MDPGVGDTAFRRAAQAAIWARPVNPNLVRMCWIWASAVRWATLSRVAICLLVRSAAIVAASRVFPTPPGPVSVTRRFSGKPAVKRALSVRIPRLTVKTMTNPSLVQNALVSAHETGIAHDSEGSSLGTQCVAAPILRHSTAEVIGAISLTFGTTERIVPTSHQPLARAAMAIGRQCS
jgi:hypothetical protein